MRLCFYHLESRVARSPSRGRFLHSLQCAVDTTSTRRVVSVKESVKSRECLSGTFDGGARCQSVCSNSVAVNMLLEVNAVNLIVVVQLVWVQLLS